MISNEIANVSISEIFQNVSQVSVNLKNRGRIPGSLIMILVFYILGIIGSSLALMILRFKGTKKNKKYKLMLRCLMAIDLIGLLGMLTQLLLSTGLPEELLSKYKYFYCTAFVVFRYFGLSSGCVAAVMALERWLALSKPFAYHKYVTIQMIRSALMGLCCIAAVITFLPLFGYGIFYDEPTNKCVRYRDATNPNDQSYAYLFGSFGVLVCAVIVGCNMFVIKVLYLISKKRPIPTLKQQFSQNEQLKPGYNNTSLDEIRFAKLMTCLSISFLLCWMPQMAAIPLVHHLPQSHWFFRVADILMLVHFTSDPFVYVLFRCKDPRVLICIKRFYKQDSRTTLET